MAPRAPKPCNTAGRTRLHANRADHVLENHSKGGRAHAAVRDALVLRDDNLGHRAVRGAGFTIAGIMLRTGITLGSVAVLARLLSPADFGYIAMATVVTEFAALFGNFGFAAVLIQKRVITRLQIDTVFWASTVLGVVLTVAVLLLSYLATALFREPIAGELLRVLCLSFIINGLVVAHGALLARMMRFGVDFWIEIIAMASRAGISILFAWNGYGVWSLVFGPLAGSIIRVILFFLVVPYWPRVRFSTRYLKSTWLTNSSYFAGGFLFYVNTTFDLMLIGRSLGATALGYYQNARSLTDEVRNRMAIPLQRVLFPAFSTLQNNTDWLQVSVMRSGRLLAAVVFPVGIGIAAIADELVPVLYGDQWLAMIPILKLLGIATAIKASTAVVTPLYNAMNRVGLALRYNIIGTVITLGGVLVALPWGLNAIAGAIALSSLYSFYGYRIGLGLIGLGWKAVATTFSAPVVASMTMWGILELVRTSEIVTSLESATRLLLLIALGAGVYLATMMLIARDFARDFRWLVEKIRPANGKSLRTS
jgi:O-antigen/teichoic acid export membrane protein